MGLEEKLGSGFLATKLEFFVNWARKFSLFQYPFITACCGMEFMSTMCAHYDLARFGAEFPRFTPRQADFLIVVGTISHKLAPVLRRVYEQMCEPKWVIAFGGCASCGGPYDNYATLQGVDRIIPVDVYIPGCPPRPEMVLDGLIRLQEKIQKSKLGDDSRQRQYEEALAQAIREWKGPKVEVPNLRPGW